MDPVPLSAPVLPPVPAAYKPTIAMPVVSVAYNDIVSPVTPLPPLPVVYQHIAAPVIPPPLPTVPDEYQYMAAPVIPSPPHVPDVRPTPPPSKTNAVRLIYAKSGFYLKSTNPMADDSIHGFLAIFSKSMVNKIIENREKITLTSLKIGTCRGTYGLDP